MQVVQLKPWDKFLGTCKEGTTQDRYIEYLRLFMIYFKIGPPLEKLSVKESIEVMKESCEEILKQSLEQLEDMIIQYIDFMKKSKLSPDSINGRVAGIKKFLKSNRFRLDWEHISEFKPNAKKNHNDEAYSREQIELMLKYCPDVRMKCIVLIYASTGIRLGAFETIQIKHMKPVDTSKGKLYEFILYPGSNYQYITYCTPECRSAIDEYLDFRKRAGEVITNESYLIRKQFDIHDLQQVKNDCAPVKRDTISSLVHNILVKSGIRQVNPGGKNKGFRHDTQMDHAFRKWYISQCSIADLKFDHRELLAGHTLPLTGPSYVRIKKELLGEYLKAIEYLTIDQSFTLQKKVEEQKEELSQLDLWKIKYQRDMSAMNKQLSELQKFRLESLKGSVRTWEEIITHMNKDPDDVVGYQEKLIFMQKEKKEIEKEIEGLETKGVQVDEDERDKHFWEENREKFERWRQEKNKLRQGK